jgi:hypothetical protein
MATKNGGRTSVIPRPEQPKQRPAFEVRYGRLKATVWRQDSEQSGPWYTTVLTRSYKDDSGNWQSSQSFGRDDMLVIAKLCDRVHSWIWQEQANQQRERQPGEDDEPAPY